jgi:hypothetical protein
MVNINKRNPAEEAYNVVMQALNMIQIIVDVRERINF